MHFADNQHATINHSNFYIIFTGNHFFLSTAVYILRKSKASASQNRKACDIRLWDIRLKLYVFSQFITNRRRIAKTEPLRLWSDHQWLLCGLHSILPLCRCVYETQIYNSLANCSCKLWHMTINNLYNRGTTCCSIFPKWNDSNKFQQRQSCLSGTFLTLVLFLF